jgi:hypothetical protein
MLRRLDDLEGYPIEATNGAIGQVTDFLFDDEAWVVRYLVVQTGEWLSNRISPDLADCDRAAGLELPHAARPDDDGPGQKQPRC